MSLDDRVDAENQKRLNENQIADVADQLETANLPDSGLTGNKADAYIDELAKLDVLEYEQKRKEAARLLAIRTTTLDQLVVEARNQSDEAALVQDLPVWMLPVDGAELLDEISKTIRAYVFTGAEQVDVATLWVAASHVYQSFHIFPRLNITAPEKECGKSTLLDVLTKLTRRSIDVQNMTVATLFRLIEEYAPTLLVDEYDSFLRQNDELRGLINAGHKKGSQVPRCVGDDNRVKLFKVYAPVVLSGIGDLPGTILDRSIVIRMVRAKRDEIGKIFDSRHTGEMVNLCRRLTRWTTDNINAIEAADPAMPEGAYNRVADNWRPLFAVAQLAGGDWPNRVEAAFKKLIERDAADSARVQLLHDIKEIFEEKRLDRIASATLVNFLEKMEHRPWPEWKNGKPITVRQLARLLRPFDIKPTTIRIGDITAKGYELEWFTDAFSRYPPSQTVTPSQPLKTSEKRENRSVTSKSDVTDEKRGKPLKTRDCYDVTDQIPPLGGNGTVDDEAFQERAAIAEFDGGFTREEAERLARGEA